MVTKGQMWKVKIADSLTLFNIYFYPDFLIKFWNENYKGAILTEQQVRDAVAAAASTASNNDAAAPSTGDQHHGLVMGNKLL